MIIPYRSIQDAIDKKRCPICNTQLEILFDDATRPALFINNRTLRFIDYPYSKLSDYTAMTYEKLVIIPFDKTAANILGPRGNSKQFIISFKCPNHYYYSDLTLDYDRTNKEIDLYCYEETLLLSNNDDIIQIRNILDLDETKISVAKSKNCPKYLDNYSLDFSLAILDNFSRLHQITVPMLSFNTDLETLKNKIHTYIIFS